MIAERERQEACPRPHASWWRTDTTRLTSAGRRKRMNGFPRRARIASSAGKDLLPSDSRPNGMLSAQAHDFPAAGQGDPKWGWGVGG